MSLNTLSVNPHTNALVAGGFNDTGMPLEDTLATYGYFIEKADAFKLAYICLMQYHPDMDPGYDGKYIFLHSIQRHSLTLWSLNQV